MTSEIQVKSSDLCQSIASDVEMNFKFFLDFSLGMLIFKFNLREGTSQSLKLNFRRNGASFIRLLWKIKMFPIIKQQRAHVWRKHLISPLLHILPSAISLVQIIRQLPPTSSPANWRTRPPVNRWRSMHSIHQQ